MKELTKKKLIELTKNLISVPSYRDGVNNESLLVDFLYEYLIDNIPWMSVELLKVEGNRRNILIKDSYPTRLLIIDHIDTVFPSSNWKSDPCKAYINNGKLFGLGSSDTKGNIASFLTALEDFKKTKGLAILLYVDEEYDFKGMKSFIASTISKDINPEYICSIDGSGISLGFGCRGLIEMKLTMKGVTAHSASGKGISVNKVFMQVMKEAEGWLNQFSDDFLGKSSINIARVNSGALEGNKQSIKFSEEGNKIPDYLESILEIRTTSNDLTYKSFVKFLDSVFKNIGILDVTFQEKHNLSGYKTNLKDIEIINNVVRDKINGYLDPGVFGYLDISLLKNIYPNAKLFSLGIGTDGQAHRANEYIEIENLFKGYEIYKQLLNIILN